LAKEKSDSGGPPKDTAESILKLTIAGNLTARGKPGLDVYKTRNAILEHRRKVRVHYDRRTGTTRPGYSAEHLRQDCERRSNDSHSESLGRTIKNATGASKPYGAASHHIVASKDPEAETSRTMLFDWGIGINDADNGVYLPQLIYGRPSQLPKATMHDFIHTFTYHYNVEARLLDVASDDVGGARAELRAMRKEIMADEFPYRKQL
jgi:hypothetical protein